MIARSERVSQHGHIEKELFMKNWTKLFGIIALIAVLGFSIVSCKEPDDDDDGGIDHGDGNMLIVNGIENLLTSTTFSNIASAKVEIYPAGTAYSDRATTQIVAGAGPNNQSAVLTESGGKISLTSYLYTFNNKNMTGNRWKGTGTFWVYIELTYKTVVNGYGGVYTTSSGDINFNIPTVTLVINP